MSRRATLCLVLAGLVGSLALAQEPVKKLRDLVGVRASSAESEMHDRGYEWVKTDKSGEAAYSYWIEEGTDRCVTVRTEDGKYASIVYAPSMDCEDQQSHAGHASAGSDDEKSFDTVCGVETGGKTYRYRCHLENEGCDGGGSCKTHLDFPDMSMTLVWKKDGKVAVQIEGMNEQTTTSTFQNGQTRFSIEEGKTYFVYRKKERAEQELAKLKE